MRRRNKEIDETEEVEEVEELSEKELKKLKHKEATEKRKNAKRKDKVARWGGVILLGLIMFVGFLLWVSGEMNQDPTSSRENGTPLGAGQNTTIPMKTQDQTIIVK